MPAATLLATQQTQDVESMLVLRWSTVYDAGPTLHQHDTYPAGYITLLPCVSNVIALIPRRNYVAYVMWSYTGIYFVGTLILYYTVTTSYRPSDKYIL